jgi:hypothetical protein
MKIPKKKKNKNKKTPRHSGIAAAGASAVSFLYLWVVPTSFNYRIWKKIIWMMNSEDHEILITICYFITKH